MDIGKMSIDDVEEMDIKDIDINAIEEILESLEGDEPVVEGAKVECSRSPNKDATMRIINQSYDTRNGNKILRNTDIYFSPDNFGYCKGESKCLPMIESGIWRDCDHNNFTSGHPSVTKKSYMVCIRGSGLIYVKENGQIEAEGIQYGRHLSVTEIEELITYFFQKMEWSVEEDINNVEYIAMCMKLAGMDTRMSIEFFLLSCCLESRTGTELVEIGVANPGRGLLQLTGLSNDSCQKFAEEGNKWKIIAGKNPINWLSNPPSQKEIELTFSERENGLAWESSIAYWCFEGRGPHASINDYIVKYEMHDDNQTDVGDEYQYAPEGLYFVVECYLNGADASNAGEMREGNIDGYLIEKNPDPQGKTDYLYFKMKEDGSIDRDIPCDAPNGLVERARLYMQYYDKKEKIWNFSDDIVEHWEDIPT